MNTFLFTMSRDEDGKYRIDDSAITVGESRLSHQEITAKSSYDLKVALNTVLHHLGKWSILGYDGGLVLETEIEEAINIPFRIASPWPVADEPTVDIMALFDARNSAKKEKDFKRADSIRDELKSHGWSITDTPKGAKLSRIK